MGRLVDYTNTRPAPALVGNEEIILRSGAGASIQTTTQGIADLATLNVNTTLFVDPVNGSASGVRGDMKRPFNTLANAEAAASSGDTFVCRPGNCGGVSIGTNTYSIYAMPGSICSVQASTGGTWNCYGPGSIQADLNHASGTLNLFNCNNVSSMNITAAGSIDFYGSCNVSTMNFPAPVVPTVTNYGYLSVITQWLIGTSLTIDNRGCLVSIPAFHASLSITGAGLAIDDTNNQARINSTLVVQQDGGTPGTDEVQISSNGTDGIVESKTGKLRLDAPSGIQIKDSGITLMEVTASGVFIYDEKSIYMREAASAAADVANYGQIWVKNATPNELWFTDDGGTDHQLGGGLTNIVEDTTPQLGGSLDTQGNDITAGANVQKIIATELQVWDDAEGSSDYTYVNHTGTYGEVKSASGYLYLTGTSGLYVRHATTVLQQLTSSSNKFYKHVLKGSGTVDIGSTGNPFDEGYYIDTLWLKDRTSDPSVPSTDWGGLYVKDVAGTKEVFAIDGGGTASQLTSHPADAPPVMYDEVAGVEEFSRSSNYYRGEIRWVNRERVAKLVGMTDAEKSALSADERVTIIKESFDEYNARMGYVEGDAGFLELHDWDADQLEQQANYDKDVADTEAELAEHQSRKDAEVAKRAEIVAFKPTVTKNAILADLDAKIEAEEDADEKAKLQEQRDKVAARNFITEKAERVAKVDQEIANLDAEEPEVLPAKNIKKPKPQWLS